MEIGTFTRRLGAIVVSAALASCQSSAPAAMSPADPGAAAFVLDRAAAIERLADPPSLDWSVGRLNTRDVAVRQRELGEKAPRYSLAALATKTSTLSNDTNAATGFPGSGGGAISSAPAFHYLTDKAFWLTDSGYLLSKTVPSSGDGTPTASTGAAWQIKDMGGTNQTFKNSSISMSNDGKRIYLCSLQGNFLVIDAATGATIFSHAMGENTSITETGGGASLPPDTCPAPFVDPLASLPTGRSETVYAVGNNGNGTSNTTTLFRFEVRYNPAAAPTTTATLAQSYDLGLNYVAPYLEGVRTSPIVIAGRAILGSWKRHNTTASLDIGSVLYYDTQVRTGTTAVVAGAVQISKTGVPNPVWAPLAVDVDDSFVPFISFVSGSYQVTGVDVNGGTLGNSPPLLIDKKTVPTEDAQVPPQTISPASSLSNYPYDSTGIQKKIIYPVQSPAGTYSAAVVSETAKSLYDDAGKNLGITVDNSRFFSYSTQNGADSPQVAAFGYVMFQYTTADRFVGVETTPRTVNKIRVRLDNTVNSNCGCVGKGSVDSNVAGMHGWAVENTLPVAGTTWTVGTIAPTDRPAFANGDAFTFTNASKGMHNGEKLVPDTASYNNANANSFTATKNPYDWLADGLIAENVAQTFAFYDDNTQDGASKNPGKPFNVGTPYFTGGSGAASKRPQLELELSGSGLGNPNMLVPVTIDSYTMQIFAVNTNALYRICYEPFVTTGYTALSIPERFVSMADTQKTFYAHTFLGSNASYGPIFTHATAPTKRYVSNYSAPLLTGTRVYVMDNWFDTAGLGTRTSLNEFTVGTNPTVTLGTGTAPALSASIDLTAANADAKAGASYMLYDFESTRLIGATYSPGTTSGRAWIFNR